MRIGEMKESKFLKKEEVGRGALFTIRELHKENVAGENQEPDEKFVLFFDEAKKGLVLNWTNIQLIAQAVGSEETSDWIGKKIVLYEDPNVSFGGKLTGGIRCRAPRQDAIVSKEAVEPPPFDDGIPF